MKCQRLAIGDIVQLTQTVGSVRHSQEHRRGSGDEGFHVAHGDFKGRSLGADSADQLRCLLLGAVQRTRRQNSDVGVGVSVSRVQFAPQLFDEDTYRTSDICDNCIYHDVHEPFIIAARRGRTLRQAAMDHDAAPRGPSDAPGFGLYNRADVGA